MKMTSVKIPTERYKKLASLSRQTKKAIVWMMDEAVSEYTEKLRIELLAAKMEAQIADNELTDKLQQSITQVEAAKS
jgi:predicted DNA-binding protein